MDTRAAACLGKLPTHGDFVKHRASTPTMRAFDEWVRNGLYQARNRSGVDWESHYDQAPVIHFLFSGRGQQAPNALLGVFRPSRDRTGRTYPFAVTCEVPKRSLQPRQLAYLPTQAHEFYDAADRIVREATDTEVPHSDVLDKVKSLEAAFSAPPAAPREHKRFLQEKTLGPFLKRIFGHFNDSGKYRLFDNLLKILLPQRKRSKFRLNYGIQFPLGQNSPLTNTACFWLETSLRLVDYPPIEPTFFWTAQHPEGAPAFLLFFTGEPRPHYFFHLLAADHPNENICHLEFMGSQNNAEAALSIPEEYGTLLEDEQLCLWDFIRSL